MLLRRFEPFTNREHTARQQLRSQHRSAVLFSCFIASEGNISILYFRRRFYFFLVFFFFTLLPVLGLRRIKCLCTEIIECDINFSWGFSVWQQSVRQSNRYILLFFERCLSVVRFIYFLLYVVLSVVCACVFVCLLSLCRSAFLHHHLSGAWEQYRIRAVCDKAGTTPRQQQQTTREKP